jgi:hypothetical protein
MLQCCRSAACSKDIGFMLHVVEELPNPSCGVDWAMAATTHGVADALHATAYLSHVNTEELHADVLRQYLSGRFTRLHPLPT